MEALQNSVELLGQQMFQIKWILAGLLVVFISLLVTTVFVVYRLMKSVKEESVSDNPREKMALLLEQDDLEQLIRFVEDRIKTRPKDLHAHWYLGQAYYRKKEWVKALREFDVLYDIVPSWREEHLDPYITAIRERLKNFKPEIVKD
jgi:cytochrome c-type biogenesis protein CcmH/NrfG